MNQQPLSKDNIKDIIRKTWSTIDQGMIELIANELYKANISTRELANIIREVAINSTYKPTLKSFIEYLPKKIKTANRNYSIFGLIFPSNTLMDKFTKAYEKSDWIGCVDVLLENEWDDQNMLAQKMIGQLSQMEKEKQQRAIKYRTSVSPNNIMSEYLSLAGKITLDINSNGEQNE